MEQEPSRSDLELLRYANAVRTRPRRGLGVTTIAVVFITCTIVDAFASTSARAFPVFSDWPARTVRIIVPFRAGSANDIAARAYAEGLSRRWSRPVLVENNANAIAGASALANVGDDHTLFYGSASTIIVKPPLGETLPYEPVLDMVPIAAGGSSVLVIAVTASLPVHSLKDLVELARAKPGALSWSAGPRPPHFALAATIRRHQLGMVNAPYRGAADLSGARTHLMSTSLRVVAGPINAGKVRILAVTGPRREPLLPDVPTVAEAGFPEMEIEDLSGLFGWRGMSPELRDRIAADMRAVAQDPVLRMRFEASGQRTLTGTPADFAAAIGRQRIRIQQTMHIVDLRTVMTHDRDDAEHDALPIHRGHARNATSPPSIGNSTPVTQRDSSEAR